MKLPAHPALFALFLSCLACSGADEPAPFPPTAAGGLDGTTGSPERGEAEPGTESTGGTASSEADNSDQALHDHPEITPKLRAYRIAGPNRRINPNSSRYIADSHPGLWIIEADETYRGFFNGGDMSDGYGNRAWPAEHVAGHGALGDFFIEHRSDIKMGDTPSVLYTLDDWEKMMDRAAGG